MVPRKTSIKRLADPATSDKDKAEGPTPAKVPKKVMFLSQEAKIIQCLLGENKAKRMHQVRQLPLWFTRRGKSSYRFVEEDLMRIWTGLLHTMRLSDQPQVQEELVELAAQMVDSFGGNTKCSLAYFSAFMRTTGEEHSKVKLKSMEKWVLMLVRLMLRHVLRLFKLAKWSPELIAAFNKSMQASVLSDNPPSRGLTVHYLSIFFEELAKEADGDITAAQVSTFLLPFVTYMATQQDGHLLNQCRAKVLYYLLYQSQMARDYGKRYTASIDDFGSLKKKIFSLDPLVGNVDWKLPVLPLKADCVLDELNNLCSTGKLKMRRCKSLGNLIQVFETYKSGKFPFAVVDHIEKVKLQKTTKSRDPQLATPQPLDSGEQVEILSPEQQLVNLVETIVLACIENEKDLVNKLAADEQTAVVKQKTIKEEKSEEQTEQLNKDEEPETSAPTAVIKQEPRTNTAELQDKETPMIVQQSVSVEHGEQEDLAPTAQQELQMADIQQFAAPPSVGSGEEVGTMSPEQQMEVELISDEVEIVHQQAADKLKADDKPQAKKDEQLLVTQQTKGPNEKLSVSKTLKQRKKLNKNKQPKMTAPTAVIKQEPRTNTAELQDKETPMIVQQSVFVEHGEQEDLAPTAQIQQFAAPPSVGSGEQVGTMSPEQQMEVQLISDEVEVVHQQAAHKLKADDKPQAKKDEQLLVNQQTKDPNEIQSVSKTFDQPKQLNADEQPQSMAAKAETKPEPQTKAAGLQDKDTPKTAKKSAPPKHGEKKPLFISRRELSLIRKYDLVKKAKWLDLNCVSPKRVGRGDWSDIKSLKAKFRSSNKNKVEEVNEQNAGERNEDGEPKAKKAKEAEQLTAKKTEQTMAKNLKKPQSKNPQPLHAKKELPTKVQEKEQSDGNIKEQQPNQPKKDDQPKPTAPAKATQKAANGGDASLKQGNPRDNAVPSQRKMKPPQKGSSSRISNASSCEVVEVNEQNAGNINKDGEPKAKKPDQSEGKNPQPLHAKKEQPIKVQEKEKSDGNIKEQQPNQPKKDDQPKPTSPPKSNGGDASLKQGNPRDNAVPSQQKKKPPQKGSSSRISNATSCEVVEVNQNAGKINKDGEPKAKKTEQTNAKNPQPLHAKKEQPIKVQEKEQQPNQPKPTPPPKSNGGDASLKQGNPRDNAVPSQGKTKPPQKGSSSRISNAKACEVIEVNQNAGKINKDGEPNAEKAKSEQHTAKKIEQSKGKNPQPLHAKKEQPIKVQKKEQQPNQPKKDDQPKPTSPPKSNGGDASLKQGNPRANVVPSQQKKPPQKRNSSRISNASSCEVVEVNEQPMQPKTTAPLAETEPEEPQGGTAVLPRTEPSEITNKTTLYSFCSCI